LSISSLRVVLVVEIRLAEVAVLAVLELALGFQ
jgi:hypothetical protein